MAKAPAKQPTPRKRKAKTTAELAPAVAEAPRRPGRPSTYTPILAERICTLIAQGKSKRQIEDMEGMPNRETIDAWMLKHEGFASQYARACEARTEAQAEEIVEISDRDDLPADQKRVMIDARKWVASKLLPKKYGDSVTVKGDKDNPLQVVSPRQLSDADLLALAAGEAALDG